MRQVILASLSVVVILVILWLGFGGGEIVEFERRHPPGGDVAEQPELPPDGSPSAETSDPHAPFEQLSVRVLEADGKPCAGVLVEARLRRSVHFALDHGGPSSLASMEPAFATTDKDGRVRLSILTAGVWSVRAGAPGKAPARALVDVEPLAARQPLLLPLLPAVKLTGRVIAPDGSPIAAAAVSAWEEGDDFEAIATARSEIDGTYVLEGLPPTRIAIRAGRATDPADLVATPRLPVRASFDIVLRPTCSVRGETRSSTGRGVPDARVRLVTESERRTVRTVATDDRGRYRFDGIPAGATILVTADADGYLTVPGTESSPRVEEGRTYVQDFLFSPTSGGIGGRVVGGGELRRVTVRALGLDVDDQVVLRATRADEAGNYEFTALPDGEYAVFVVAPEWNTAGLPRLPATPDPDLVRTFLRAGVFGRVTVPIAGAQRMEHDVELERGGTASGVVLDPSGRPLAGAVVRVVGEPAMDIAVTERDGRFELSGLPRRRSLRLVADHPDHSPAGQDLPAASATAAHDDLRIVLAAATVLQGKVQTPDGIPAIVRLELEHKGRDRPLTARQRYVPLDEHGRYAVRGPAADTTAALIAEAQGCAAARVEGIEMRAGAAIDLAALQLEPLTTLTGRVATGADSTPVPHALVTVHLAGGDVDAFSAADGEFELTLPRGAPRVLDVRAHGYMPEHDRRVRSGTVIGLRPSGAVSGLVRSPDGAPVVGMDLTLAGMNAGDPVRVTRTDARGGFEFVGVERGRATVSGSPLRAGSSVVAVMPTTVAIPSDDVVLAAHATSAIGGRVLDASGAPAGNTFVRARSGALELSAITSPDGAFEILGTDGGVPFELVAGAWGTPHTPSEPASARGGRAGLELRTSRGVDLEVVFVDAADASVQLSRDTLITITAPATPGLRVEATPDGSRLAVPGLPEGALQIRVTPGRTDRVLPATISLETLPRGAVHLKLRRSAALRGVVHETNGAPVAAAEVRVATELDLLPLDLDESVVHSARTDAEGRFVVTGLDPEVAYFVAVAGWGDLGVACTTGVRPSDHEIDLVPQRGDMLGGRLVKRGGGVAEGVTLVVLDDAGLPLAWALTLPDGRFHLSGLPARGGRLVARRQDVAGGGIHDTSLGRVEPGAEELEVTIE